MHNDCTRRQWLAAAAGAAMTRPFAPAASAAVSSMGPTPRVAIAKCPTYGAELLPAMQRMFDQLGGLERLVKGKTVAIKINMTGDTSYRLGHTPAEDTHYTHPRVIAATVHLMGRAGGGGGGRAGKWWGVLRGPARGGEHRAARGVREHQLSGPRAEVCTHGDPQGRPHVPGVRSEPFLPGLLL